MLRNVLADRKVTPEPQAGSSKQIPEKQSALPFLPVYATKNHQERPMLESPPKKQSYDVTSPGFMNGALFAGKDTEEYRHRWKAGIPSF
jgi:hypothetical protein